MKEAKHKYGNDIGMMSNPSHATSLPVVPLVCHDVFIIDRATLLVTRDWKSGLSE